MPADGDPSELGIAVVDASVVVALCASEPIAGDAVAARLLGMHMHAPIHLPVEVDSAIRGLVLGGRITTAEASAARAVAEELPIDLWPWHVVGDRAWELRANLSTYDAGYVALAEYLDAPLLTGDARIAHAPGIRCAVELFR